MNLQSALRELNNALLDLQLADYNTYERPLKRIAAALRSDALKPISEELRARVDFDAFVGSSNEGSSMAGSASLNWPTDREDELGLTIELIYRGADNPRWLLDFAHNYYYASSSKIMSAIRKLTTSVLLPFGRDFRVYVDERAPQSLNTPIEPADFHRVFIVHGHDEAPRETVARFISSVGLEPVILHEQANRGMTIAEKLTEYGNVGFAIVLLTPDDVGRAKTAAVDMPRARQNVILELGYFVGRLGRERVCALLKGEMEIPSDYMGVVYTKFDEGGGWRQQLAKELQAVGYQIDWNKVMR